MFADATFQSVRRVTTSRSHQFRYGGGGIQEFPDLCHAAADGGLSAVRLSDDAARGRKTADPVEATSAYSHLVLLVEFTSQFLMLMIYIQHIKSVNNHGEAESSVRWSL